MKIDVTQAQQWLTDISATRGLDSLNDGFSEAEKSRASFLSHVAKFKEMYTRENDKKMLQEIEEITRAFENYYEEEKIMADAYVKDGPHAGNRLMKGFDKTAEILRNRLDPFVDQQKS